MEKNLNNKLTAILLIIFITALMLRLSAVFIQKQYEKMPGQDGKAYDNIALNLVSGKGYIYTITGVPIPTAHRPPGYPLFLAAIYLIFGHSYLAVNIIQAVLGALLCVVIFFVARLIYDNNIEGIIASALVAVYKPFFWGFYYYGGPGYILTEYIFMFMLGWIVWTFLLYIKTSKRRFAILSGALMGAAILTRAEFIVYPLLLSFYFLYTCRYSVKKFFMKYFLIYFLIALTMTPWVVRNYVVFKKFIPLSNSRGYGFLYGNNPSARGGAAVPENMKEIDARGAKDESEQDRIYMQEAIRYVKTHPKRSAMLLFRKVAVHWMPFENGFRVFNPYYAFALIFALVGFIFYRRRVVAENLLLIMFLNTTLAAMLTFGEPRYRYPYEIFLLIFAAHALNKIFGISKRMD